MELILIRHGLPEKVINEDGSPADPPLSTTGLEQARKVADWLKDHEIDRLYSSPMQRAFQTAEPLARVKELEIEVRDGVAEYDQQAGDYIPVEQLKEFDYERWRRLMSGNVDEVDFQTFCKVVISTIEKIIAENRGKKVAITCHGGVINVWTAHVIGFEPKMFFNPNYTSINRFMAASSGEKSVITLNEHSHLM
ncbi:MAG: histidine phosphatase family protein [Gammaproteobacteria bacterium]|nr:histidine phosphatase family protein [Gammaproteobacteria bacterium]